MEKVKSFFWWCSGASQDILSKCSSEQSKFFGIGATVFFTGLFAALSGAYALYMVFDSYIFSILFAMVWGLMIFNLDRYIVSSMRKEGRAINELKMATPRIILAIIISIVIARPLELKVFEKEINGELAIMEQEFLTKQQDAIKDRFNDERMLYQNQVAQLKKEIAAKTVMRDKLSKIAQEEADGTGGSMKKNAGPIYQIKKADADKVDAELQELTKKNMLLINEKEGKIAEIESAMNAETALVQRQKIDGPAARLEALSRLSDNSFAISIASWFILFLFIALETAPVFVKLISPMGPYDHLLKLEEYAFEIKRAEDVGVMTAKAKERTGALSNLEREFVEGKLNESMYKS
jgi:hypothetical protein